jgi:dihydroorotate dehydrogenase (NAD+) catalytic subunit
VAEADAPAIQVVGRHLDDDAIADAGADALTAVNTLSGIALAPTRDRPLLGNVYGGVSGPAIKPIALRIVYEVAQVVDVPIVAIGGVTELGDVLDYLAAGAVAVQVGTAIFADPALPVRLVDELAGECRRRGLATHRDLVGTALPPRATQPSAKGVEYRP